MQKWSKMLTQKVPLGHLLPSHPLIQNPNYSAAEYFHFLPSTGAKYSIDKQAKFVADGKFWKYIGFHLFPLRRLLVDNCVEQRSVSYKKIFGGFNSG